MCKYIKLGIALVATGLAFTNPAWLGIIFIAEPLCKVVAGLLGKECCQEKCCKEFCPKECCPGGKCESE